MKTFPLVLLAEVVKLSQRKSARIGWVMSATLGALMPLLLFAQLQAGLLIMGVEAAEYFGSDASRPLVWSLYLRNLLLIRVFIVVLGAQSMASEFSDRTLRESLLRSVPRYQVVLAKWLGLLAWDVVSLTLTFGIGAVLGLAAFGLSGDWLIVATAFLLNFCTDAALIALTLLVAVATRSALATLGGLLVLLIVDLLSGWALFVLSTGTIVNEPWVLTVAEQYPVLLNAALGVWSSVLPGYTLDYRSLASLLVILVGSLFASLLVFQRTDVP